MPVVSRRSLLAVALAGAAATLASCAASPSPSASPAPGTAAPSTGGASASAAALRIGICQIVSHPSLDAIRQGFKDGMKAAGYAEGQAVTYDEQNPQGDQATLTSIAGTFKSQELDLVLAITTPAAQAMAQAITDRPIVFAGVTDPVSTKLVASWDAPGGNLTGTSDFPPIEAQLALVKRVAPAAKTVGMIYSSSEANASVQVDLAKAAAAKAGLTLVTKGIVNSSEVQQAAEALAADAFFVSNDNTVVSAIESVIQVAEQRKVPVIASDPDSLKRGATAAYAVDQYRMGYNAAKIAVRILAKGEKPAAIPVEKQTDLQLGVNLAAAKRIGLTLPADLVAEATTKIES